MTSKLNIIETISVSHGLKEATRIVRAIEDGKEVFVTQSRPRHSPMIEVDDDFDWDKVKWTSWKVIEKVYA